MPPNAAVGLKDGINISELTSGAMFEVDLSTVANEPKEQFDKEEILKNLDVSCSLGEDYSSSDDDLVKIIIYTYAILTLVWRSRPLCIRGSGLV